MELDEKSQIKVKDDSEYIKVSKKATISILILLNSYSFLLTLSTFIGVPRFKEYYNELLEGEPLPSITNLLLNSYRGLWLIPLILTILCASLFFKKDLKPIIPVLLTLAIIVSSIILTYFISSALFAPLLDILDKLGGGA